MLQKLRKTLAYELRDMPRRQKEKKDKHACIYTQHMQSD